MNQFKKEFKKEAEKINLSKEEQVILREKILSFMEFHPLETKNTPRQSSRNLPNSTYAEDWLVINLKKWKILKWSSLALVLTLTTIPYLAEKAVPGDSLYAVKVNFNEEVKSSLTFGPYNKIVWEAERLNRRISEINLLAHEGKVTEKIEAGVVEAVKNHRDRAKKEIENLKLSDKDGAILMAVQLDAIIDIQSANLKKASEVNHDSESLSSKILDILDKESETNREFYIGTDISWERLVVQVEKETKRAYDLLQVVERRLSTEEQSSLKRRLEDISRKINLASEKESSSTEEAKKILVDVLIDTQKLIIIMTNSSTKTSIDLEEIIPITLTEEERVEKVRNNFKISQNLLEKLTKAIDKTLLEEGVVQTDVREKIETAIIIADNDLNEIKPLLEDSDINLEKIEEKSNNALQILKDAQSLLKNKHPTTLIDDEVDNDEDILLEETEEDKNKNENLEISNPSTKDSFFESEDGENDDLSTTTNQIDSEKKDEIKDVSEELTNKIEV